MLSVAGNFRHRNDQAGAAARTQDMLRGTTLSKASSFSYVKEPYDAAVKASVYIGIDQGASGDAHQNVLSLYLVGMGLCNCRHGNLTWTCTLPVLAYMGLQLGRHFYH